MSGSQGLAFAMAAQTMTERIRKLGPNPIEEQSRCKRRKSQQDQVKKMMRTASAAAIEESQRNAR